MPILSIPIEDLAMILEDDLNRAYQAVGFLAADIERRIRAGEDRDAVTRYAWELLEIKTHRQRSPLWMVENGIKDNGEYNGE